LLSFQSEPYPFCLSGSSLVLFKFICHNQNILREVFHLTLTHEQEHLISKEGFVLSVEKEKGRSEKTNVCM
jgi:hypothetical protein